MPDLGWPTSDCSQLLANKISPERRSELSAVKVLLIAAFNSLKNTGMHTSTCCGLITE